MKKAWMVALGIAIALAACGKSTSTDSDSTGGGGGGGSSGIPSVLQHTWLKCNTLDASAGSTLNGKVAETYLTMTAGGTFDYKVVYSEATTCSGPFTSGSEDVFDYDQSGTFTVDATNTDGSYNITFTVVSQYWTGRNGTVGNPMRLAVNGNCSPSPSFTNSTGDQETISGTVTCGSGFSTNYEIPSPKTTGATFKQVISSTGAQASTSTMGSRDDIFSSGQAAAYPSSMPDGWYLYQ